MWLRGEVFFTLTTGVGVGGHRSTRASHTLFPPGLRLNPPESGILTWCLEGASQAAALSGAQRVSSKEHLQTLSLLRLLYQGSAGLCESSVLRFHTSPLSLFFAYTPAANHL